MPQLILLAFLASFSGLPSQTKLMVTVENIRSDKGILKICVFDNPGDFMSNAAECAELTDFTKPEHAHTFTLDTGSLVAVVAYHDKNANGKLDRNFLGIPSEPYGFSNNPSTLFGPPSFERASFEVDQVKAIRIRL